MYKSHNSIETPNNETIIWKYMDMWKFLDLIESKELYLNRADLFDDNYEGRYPGKDQISNELSKFDIKLKNKRFLTCFSECAIENFSMWKIYTNDLYGIAIKTNIKNLIDSMKNDTNDVMIGRVEYLNTEKSYIINFENTQVLKNYFTKRKYFEYEREIRILSGLVINVNDIKGLRIKVDINTLIDEIYISPFSTDNIKNLIELKLNDIGLVKKVRKSKI